MYPTIFSFFYVFVVFSPMAVKRERLMQFMGYKTIRVKARWTPEKKRVIKHELLVLLFPPLLVLVFFAVILSIVIPRFGSFWGKVKQK